MSQRHESNKIIDRHACGFTLIEVLVSIGILSIGLLSVAALIANTMNSGTNTKFINMANTLASEKLDMLNKWPSTDKNVACTTGSCGSLTGSATCTAGDDYCDQVTMNESSGANYETQTQIVNGNPVTTTIVQTNTGCVDTPTNCGLANPTGGSTFTRRWLITTPVTVTSAGGTTTTVGTAATGPRRITVVVTLNDQAVQPPISFQMSMVRP
ncbi:MAG TPA: prepilin-type N-terminal cleavage/methylation domain-containing protein [Terriglobales bacterium]|nr:prepilin-type N-terminal cleavage/methylation domain-containing protein [Terriglobales bacterium]